MRRVVRREEVANKLESLEEFSPYCSSVSCEGQLLVIGECMNRVGGESSGGMFGAAIMGSGSKVLPSRSSSLLRK